MNINTHALRRAVLSVAISLPAAIEAQASSFSPEVDVEEWYASPPVYDHAAGLCFFPPAPCGVTGYLSLETSDNWRTATLDYRASENDRFFIFRLPDAGFSAAQNTNPLTIGFGGDGIVILSAPPIHDADPSPAFVFGSGGVDAWSVLGTIEIEQYFYGGEFDHFARIRIKDRNVDSYNLTLWPAAVPLPFSGLLLPFGILALVALRKSRSLLKRAA